VLQIVEKLALRVLLKNQKKSVAINSILRTSENRVFERGNLESLSHGRIGNDTLLLMKDVSARLSLPEESDISMA